MGAGHAMEERAASAQPSPCDPHGGCYWSPWWPQCAPIPNSERRSSGFARRGRWLPSSRRAATGSSCSPPAVPSSRRRVIMGHQRLGESGDDLVSALAEAGMATASGRHRHYCDRRANTRSRRRPATRAVVSACAHPIGWSCPRAHTSSRGPGGARHVLRGRRGVRPSLYRCWSMR